MFEREHEENASSENAAVARERVIGLLDFLAAYDSRKNPPVHDIATYKMFLVRDEMLTQSRDILLSPGADQWLTVGFAESVEPPQLRGELEAMLGPVASMSPHPQQR